MIFGSKQNKEFADRISQAVQPMIDHVHTKHGLPTGFWQDSYALGYLMGQVNGWTSIFDGDGLSIADKGRILVDVFGALSGEKGKPISENAMVYAQQEDPDFMRANQNGMFMAMFAAEKIPNAEAIPAVVHAKQTITDAGADPTHDAVIDSLAQTIWVQEMRARMSVGA